MLRKSPWLALVLSLMCSSCAPDAPPPVAPVVAAPAPPATALTGNLGPKPFTARSALLVQPNSPTTRCLNDGNNVRRCEEDLPVSYIRVLERAVSCADLTGPAERPDIRIGHSERYIEIVLQARWPVASGAILRTDATMSAPRRDHVTASFKDGFASGAVAKGSAQFTGSAMTVDLETTNPGLPTSGRVSGTIELLVCPHP